MGSFLSVSKFLLLFGAVDWPQKVEFCLPGGFYRFPRGILTSAFCWAYWNFAFLISHADCIGTNVRFFQLDGCPADYVFILMGLLSFLFPVSYTHLRAHET